MTTRRRRIESDAFVSHARRNMRFAARLSTTLERAGLTTWLDADDVRYGALLRPSLQDGIAHSGCVLLLWSAPAAASRWVMSELFSAVHRSVPIVPIVLDPTPLPPFLIGAAYLDRTRDRARLDEAVERIVRRPPPVRFAPAVHGSLDPDVQALVDRTALAQLEVIDRLFTDRDSARSLNASVAEALAVLVEHAAAWPIVSALRGYQDKNTYLVERWDEIQAGLAPSDPLLLSSERHFFDVLCVDPFDLSAVNGLGTVLFLERELDGAEFFQRQAIALAKRAGVGYDAAEYDLTQTRRLQRAAARR